MSLGTSQQVVLDYVKEQDQAVTARQVGDALYDKTSSCTNQVTHSIDKIRLAWASRILRRLSALRLLRVHAVSGLKSYTIRG